MAGEVANPRCEMVIPSYTLRTQLYNYPICHKLAQQLRHLAKCLDHQKKRAQRTQVMSSNAAQRCEMHATHRTQTEHRALFARERGLDGKLETLTAFRAAESHEPKTCDWKPHRHRKPAVRSLQAPSSNVSVNHCPEFLSNSASLQLMGKRRWHQSSSIGGWLNLNWHWRPIATVISKRTPGIEQGSSGVQCYGAQRGTWSSTKST